jgi:hypothetical protein
MLEKTMADTKERRKAPRKATPKPDSKAATPMAANLRVNVSPDETKRLIAEAAYYRAKQRGFAPGRELEDWIEAESEVMGRINGSSD